MERVFTPSRRSFSVRSIFMFVLTVFIAALLWVTFASPQTHAISGPDATWQGGSSILYNGHQYYDMGKATAGESHGLAQGTHYYLYTPTTPPNQATPASQKVFIIYFTPGVDPPTATSATNVTYDYSSQTVFSHPSGSKSIDITPLGKETSLDSCSVDGIGWIVCPVSVFLATGMDWIFGIVSDLISVQPSVLGNSNNDLYLAWNIMRSIANVAFIIAFMIIIYSQLTSAGVSNYGLKKLLPRLIIAAVLVNMSYIVTAIAVDLSNVLGYSVQDIFVQIRQSTFNIDSDTWSSDATTWAGITGVVLSGGAITAGVVGFSIASAGSAGVIYLLLPLLLGLILTILVVLLILAARQAIIIILIIIAPLAFVAYLLPNTEKLFEKWRSIFMTMLVFFPAFSLVFGGSQLAGGIIIQNATRADVTNVFMIVFGLAVQVAPLVITPLLLKLSGGLLGRIAGMVNDPRKGLLDRTKNWSKDRAEMHRLNSLRKPGGSNPFRRIAQDADNSNRRVKERTGIYTSMNDNRYNSTDGHRELNELAHEAETDKKYIEAKLERDLNQKISSTSSMLDHEVKLRVTLDEASLESEKLNRVFEGLRTGVDVSTTQSLGRYTSRVPGTSTSRLQDTTRDLALSAISIQTSKRMQQNELSTALLQNTADIDGLRVREWAGITDAANGAESALTYAVNLQREAESKLVNERTQLMKHFKLDGAKRQVLAMGNDVVDAQDAKGNLYTFRAADEYSREAAIEMQLKTGSFDDITAIIAESGRGAREFRSTISDAIPANGLPNKALFFGGRFINEVGLGNIQGISGNKGSLTDWAAQSILGGKIKAEELANNDAGALEIYLDAAQNGVQYINPSDNATFQTNVRALKETAAHIMDPSTDLDRHATQAAKDVLKKIKNL